jgi:hypothetical protein
MLQRRAASRGGVKGPTGPEIGLGRLGLKFLWGFFRLVGLFGLSGLFGMFGMFGLFGPACAQALQ